MKQRLTLQELYEGILRSDRVVLAQAITLIESSRKDDQQLASQLMDKLIDKTGKSIRIGITGVPGVGKSTFIECLGLHIIESGKRLAVLTVDPSSQITKGSILADKTRMEKLSTHPLAFIRPTATSNTLGGVAYGTRESILLCEAAGYEVILVETVGVGQSEVSVKSMVDFFLLLMLAGAGDELQGLKKGIMEMADAIAITKADGDNIRNSENAKATLQQILDFLPKQSFWEPQVLVSSAYKKTGIAEIWELIRVYEGRSKQVNAFEATRSSQRLQWLEDKLYQLIHQDFLTDPSLHQLYIHLQDQVVNNKLGVNAAADQLLSTYRKSFQ